MALPNLTTTSLLPQEVNPKPSELAEQNVDRPPVANSTNSSGPPGPVALPNLTETKPSDLAEQDVDQPIEQADLMSLRRTSRTAQDPKQSRM